MRSAFPLALASAILAGCSEEAGTPVAGPTPAPTPALPEPAVAPLPAPPPSYPESQEVQSLLYRARELRDAGKFEEALAIADQALARDPNSPAAAALRGELWAVVTEI